MRERRGVLARTDPPALLNAALPVRVSLNGCADWTNKPVDEGGGQFADNYGICWGRVAAFF